MIKYYCNWCEAKVRGTDCLPRSLMNSGYPFGKGPIVEVYFNLEAKRDEKAHICNDCLRNTIKDFLGL